MDPIKVYWRDVVIKWIGWGTGLLAVFAGWAVDKAELFEIGPWADQADERGKPLLGVSLLVFTVGFTLCWYLGARWIYRHHLSGRVDATVIPWKYVRLYVHLIIGLLWTVACLVALL